MAKSMNIFVSQYDKTSGVKTIGQKVFFINVLNGTASDLNCAPETGKIAPPEEFSYSDPDIQDKAVCLLNYEKFDEGDRVYSEEQGFAAIKSSSEGYTSSVYRQEIEETVDENGNKVYNELTRLYPVDTQITNFKFRDFNISNNRMYRYILYPFDKVDENNAIDDFTLQRSVFEPIRTYWQGWSITELHPVDGTNKKFTATPDDVWVFNLNIDTGEQSQNISRQEQQTLGQFNRYSQGKMNYISGSVSCLLGSDVLPASYIIKNGKTVNEGGYQEIRKNDKTPTSNQRVDMLLAWRKVVMSSNPKLLKDRAGQSFLVTLSSATNKPMDAVHRQPNTISFTWTQIGNVEDIQIVDINA